ncbi:dTDP-4-dehydrorhamnose reductase [Paenibacillus illinoisensis]|uniref:dTDP-4-dehydrorhamnose reductase n=1 Tax=Paenibacillus illinoisensis TaxID=59845 RepID=UPI0034AADE39
MKYRVIVTGAAGQLGMDVVRTFRRNGHDVLACDREQLDITNQHDCNKIILSFKPHIIIHCAAYTAVDRAEIEVDAAYAVNTIGTRNIAVAAEKVKAKLIYISTDYVFDGTADQPYNEYHVTNPKTVYGKSKLAGELLVQSLCSQWFIVRTSWVFGIYGENFVKTMIHLLKSRPTLQVVDDQKGSPTYTVDLAHFISKLSLSEKYGIYHASNSEMCTWYEFAHAIAEEGGKQAAFTPTAVLVPCTTEQFPRPAPRPQYSVMDHMAIRINDLEPLRSWREALIAFLKELSQSDKNTT